MNSVFFKRVEQWLTHRISNMSTGGHDSAEFKDWFENRYKPVAGGWQY